MNLGLLEIRIWRRDSSVFGAGFRARNVTRLPVPEVGPEVQNVGPEVQKLEPVLGPEMRVRIWRQMGQFSEITGLPSGLFCNAKSGCGARCKVGGSKGRREQRGAKYKVRGPRCELRVASCQVPGANLRSAVYAFESRFLSLGSRAMVQESAFWSLCSGIWGLESWYWRLGS